jgi:hypothetical protein
MEDWLSKLWYVHNETLNHSKTMRKFSRECSPGYILKGKQQSVEQCIECARKILQYAPIYLYLFKGVQGWQSGSSGRAPS